MVPWEKVPIYYQLADGAWFLVRPSGTEPKIKFYYYAVNSDPAVSAKAVRDMIQAVTEMIDAVK